MTMTMTMTLNETVSTTAVVLRSRTIVLDVVDVNQNPRGAAYETN